MSITFDWNSYAIAMLAINVALSGTVLGLRLVKRLLQKAVEAPASQSAVEFENPTVRDRLSSNPDLSTKSSTSTKSNSSTKRSSTKSIKDEIV